MAIVVCLVPDHLFLLQIACSWMPGATESTYFLLACKNANEFIVMWYVCEQLTAIWQEGLDSAKSPSVMVWVVTEWKKPQLGCFFMLCLPLFSLFLASFFLKSKLSLLRFDFAKIISYLLLSLMLSNLLKMYRHLSQRLHQFLSIMLHPKSFHRGG